MASYSLTGASTPNEDYRIESERMLFDSDEEEDATDTPESSGGADDVEQSEGLLAKETPNAGTAARPRRLTSRGNRSWLIRISSVVIITFMIVFDLRLITRGDAVAGSYASSGADLSGFLKRPLRRADDDYILNTKWDFNAPSQERQFEWTIVEKEGNPDGIYKPMLTINGQFPGPLIEVNEGDTIVVNVHNAATNATAIHWHGIFQNGSTWMDGTSGVTQCPIAPGKTFQYRFTIRDQSGTCKCAVSEAYTRPTDRSRQISTMAIKASRRLTASLDR